MSGPALQIYRFDSATLLVWSRAGSGRRGGSSGSGGRGGGSSSGSLGSGGFGAGLGGDRDGFQFLGGLFAGINGALTMAVEVVLGFFQVSLDPFQGIGNAVVIVCAGASPESRGSTRTTARIARWRRYRLPGARRGGLGAEIVQGQCSRGKEDQGGDE